jgi:hypothetical protein
MENNQQKQWKDDRERRREYYRKHYQNNKERYKRNSKWWHELNPERSRAIGKKHYSKNAEKIRAKTRAWNKKNWIKKTWRTLSRRANGAPCATLDELSALFQKQNGLCAFSFLPIGPGISHLDHKLPSIKGGSHTIENLQWLHKQINMMKHDLTTEEFEDLFETIVRLRHK